MDLFLICLVAFFGSVLTFFSGFGLGTLLLPVFALFFPIEVAVALTAVVHFLNNLFKLILVGKHATRPVVLRFGLPAIISAAAGAWLLTMLSGMPALAAYNLAGNTFTITPAGLVIGGLLLFFALFDLLPATRKLEIHPNYLPLGGILSGFFGGLSGNQGALRSAFLVRAGLNSREFIATGVIIAVMVDISRLTVYAGEMHDSLKAFDSLVLAAATLSAFAGAWSGSRVLNKVTFKAIRILVAVMLLLFALLLMAGII